MDANTLSAPSFNPSETYVVDSTGHITRGSDSATIPPDPANSDYRAYQAWIASGKTATVLPAPPAPAPTLNFIEFMTLFTSAEQVAIFGSADVQVKIFITMAAGSGGLQLNDPRVIGGINYLAATASSIPPGPGLIAPLRAAVILTGAAPPAT